MSRLSRAGSFLFMLSCYLFFTQRIDAPERKLPYATDTFSLDALYPALAQDWEEIHFTFHRWSQDSMAVEFFYATDTGAVGTVTYSMEGQDSTGMGSLSYAKAYVKG